MRKTTLNIADELKHTGKLSEHSLEYLPETLSISGRQLVPDGNAKVHLSVCADDEQGVNITGNMSVVFIENCARCGKELKMPLECEFSERFIREKVGSTADNTDTDSYIFSGEEIDLSDFFEELIMLNYPLTVLCKEDCKGLCPKCGKNLNTGDCNCNEQEPETDTDDEHALEKALEKLKGRFTVN